MLGPLRDHGECHAAPSTVARHCRLLAWRRACHDTGRTARVARLRERGPGMHHIAYRVDDIAAALALLKARGAQLIDETPQVGLHNNLVAFVHPKSMQGVLVELVQHCGEVQS